MFAYDRITCPRRQPSRVVSTIFGWVWPQYGRRERLAPIVGAHVLGRTVLFRENLPHVSTQRPLSPPLPCGGTVIPPQNTP